MEGNRKTTLGGGEALTARLYQFVGNKKAAGDSLENNFEQEHILPELSVELIEHLFERLSPEDKIQVLRHKILPAASLPHITLYAAAGEHYLHLARSAGKRVIAKINMHDLRVAIRKKLGAELLRKATHWLRLLRPSHSAFTRITAKQSLFLSALSALTLVAWLLFDPFYFYAGLSFLCGVFFLAVIALRLLCLLPSQSDAGEPFAIVSDQDLPHYSVLVPVFREISVLNQLIHSLTKLNYPALCIKRTKREKIYDSLYFWCSPRWDSTGIKKCFMFR